MYRYVAFYISLLVPQANPSTLSMLKLRLALLLNLDREDLLSAGIEPLETLLNPSLLRPDQSKELLLGMLWDFWKQDQFCILCLADDQVEVIEPLYVFLL